MPQTWEAHNFYRTILAADITIINKIIADLKRNTSDNFWKHLNTVFQRYTKIFYSNLETRHPELSPAEKRLSAFLRLKLNTKDIAYLTHHTTGSIETSRIRLRKKFGLSHQNVNLYSYISQFLACSEMPLKNYCST